MLPFRKYIGLGGVAIIETPRAKEVGRFFDWVMFFIALFLPLSWYAEVTGRLTELQVLTVHWTIWLSFVLEFIVLLSLVKYKFLYIKRNWLNLVIIVVCFPLFWFHIPLVAVIRMLRVLVLFRVLVSWWYVARNALKRNKLGITLLVFLAFMMIGGSAISLFDSGIRTPLDGIWWAIQTITTVGYGDIVPKTLAGRFFAIVIMLMGVSLISILTANFSAYLLGKEAQPKENLELLRDLQQRMIRLEAKLDAMQKDDV